MSRRYLHAGRGGWDNARLDWLQGLLNRLESDRESPLLGLVCLSSGRIGLRCMVLGVLVGGGLLLGRIRR